MKDYSKKIDELTFLKHYLLLENEIEAKYAPDIINHYPKTEHNIECLNRELKRQLGKIKESYLPFVKRFRGKYIYLTSMWSFFLVSNVTTYIVQDDAKDLWLPLFLFGGPVILNGLEIISFQKKYQEIMDMEFVDEVLADSQIDFENLNLSENAMESLELYGNLSLNNVDSFTHKDIQKIKKAIEQKRIEK